MAVSGSASPVVFGRAHRDLRDYAASKAGDKIKTHVGARRDPGGSHVFASIDPARNAFPQHSRPLMGYPAECSMIGRRRFSVEQPSFGEQGCSGTEVISSTLASIARSQPSTFGSSTRAHVPRSPGNHQDHKLFHQCLGAGIVGHRVWTVDALYPSSAPFRSIRLRMVPLPPRAARADRVVIGVATRYLPR
jgi:hypothetical protein